MAVEAKPARAGSEATEQRRGITPLLALRLVAERWSLLIAFAGACAFFSVEKPSVFLTWANAQAILDTASVLCILAVGVTVVLVLGEFDLSIGSVVSLAAASSVAMMAHHGFSTGTAIALALALSTLVGLVNGVAVAYVRIPSFIATLAMGSIAAGFELAITQTSIFQGIRKSYLTIELTKYGGFTLQTFIALGVMLAFLAILKTTVYGRYASSVGDNPAAARLTGIPVQRVKVIGFMLTAFTGGVASVIAASAAQSYYPGIGTGYLLPAYAAAFLGLSLSGGLRFSVLGSYLGVLLLGTVTTGLTIMNEPNWTASLVQGGVLLIAVAGVAIRRRSTLGA